MKFGVGIICLLFSVFAVANGQSGYIKNVIEDDEGLKVILGKKAESATLQDVTTLHVSNTTADFKNTKQLLTNAKGSKYRVTITPDEGKNLTFKVGP